MATHNICFFNKYEFCKFLERCRRYHENKICEKLKCEIKECPLRHPKVCKLGFCKFSQWCRFSHSDNKSIKEKNKDVKKLEDRLETVEKEFERKCEKISKLESELKGIQEKNKDAEKLEERLDTIENEFEKKCETS